MKRKLKRYYDHEKVVAYLRDHAELCNMSAYQVACDLKRVGLMSPTTYYRDCSRFVRYLGSLGAGWRQMGALTVYLGAKPSCPHPSAHEREREES